MLKFRAKRLDNGEEVIGSYHHIIGNAKIIEKGTVLPMVIEKDKVHSIELSKHWILIPSLPKDVGWQITDSYLSVEIDPTTLAMSTGVTDKNGTMIFGSVPVEGLGMSKGGDVVRVLYTDWPSKSANDSRTIEQYMYDIGFTAKIQFISPSFYATLPSKFYSDEVDLCSLNVGNHGYILITGKQFDNQ